MKEKINIAIDGPAGAGKSTIAKLVADKLDYTYIDTGAMYRALTFYAIEKKIDLENGAQLGNIMDDISITLSSAKVFVNDEEVTDYIRTDAVTNNVSIVASHKAVRAKMLAMQQQLAKTGGAVMDGRDIGTHVLPNAEVKIFLTATPDERARRRHTENLAKGYDSNFEVLKEEIIRRDEMDMNRVEAPLKKAEDAIEIDSTSLSIEDVVEQIFVIVQERI